MAANFYVWQVEILSELAKIPFTSIQMIILPQIMGYGSCWAGRLKKLTATPVYVNTLFEVNCGGINFIFIQTSDIQMVP